MERYAGKNTLNEAVQEKQYQLNILLLLGFTFCVIGFRSLNAYTCPILMNEDGKFMFAYYVNNPDPAGVFRLYNGYTSFLPNIIGYASTKFPFPVAPYVMSGFSFVITVLSLTLFSFRQFRCILKSDTARMLICALLVLLPRGNFAINSSATFTLWHLLWIFILFSFVPVPQHPGSRIIHFLILFLTAWSHPLSIIGIPLFGAFLFLKKFRVHRYFYILQILSISLYWKIGLKKSAHELAFNPATLRHALIYISRRVVFEGFFGNNLRLKLQAAGLHIILDITTLLIFILLGFLLYRGWNAIPFSGRIAICAGIILIFCLTVGVVYLRSMDGTSHAGGWNQRYFYVQQLLAIFVTAVITYYGLPGIQWKNKWIIFLISGAIFFQIRSDRQYFKTNIHSGLKVRHFLHALASGEELNSYFDSKKNRYILDRGGYWNIEIDASALTR